MFWDGLKPAVPGPSVGLVNVSIECWVNLAAYDYKTVVVRVARRNGTYRWETAQHDVLVTTWFLRSPSRGPRNPRSPRGGESAPNDFHF